MTSVLVLNGPNLGRLGVREPEVYGSATLADLTAAATGWGRELGLEVEVRQAREQGGDLVGRPAAPLLIGRHDEHPTRFS
ncbi:MAG: hypothetical protein B7X40_07920, partial [Cellulomonas sp. 14-74-6]